MSHVRDPIGETISSLPSSTICLETKHSKTEITKTDLFLVIFRGREEGGGRYLVKPNFHNIRS